MCLKIWNIGSILGPWLFLSKNILYQYFSIVPPSFSSATFQGLHNFEQNCSLKGTGSPLITRQNFLFGWLSVHFPMIPGFVLKFPMIGGKYTDRQLNSTCHLAGRLAEKLTMSGFSLTACKIALEWNKEDITFPSETEHIWISIKSKMVQIKK